MKALLFTLFLPAVALAERPAGWAQPVESEALKNYYRVTDNLYRCAQPTAAGWQQLEKDGVRTVINLRFFSDDELPKNTKLRGVQVKMNAWDVDKDDIVRVLALLRQKERGPFLIHCRHGADRTGLIIAMHRIIDHGWTKEDALAEMRKGDFGFHKIWINITRYLQNLDKNDIEKLRQRVEKEARKKA
jgi:protein tyrosine/serine phosphatase